VQTSWAGAGKRESANAPAAIAIEAGFRAGSQNQKTVDPHLRAEVGRYGEPAIGGPGEAAQFALISTAVRG
jgi:hypothetical protein